MKRFINKTISLWSIILAVGILGLCVLTAEHLHHLGNEAALVKDCQQCHLAMPTMGTAYSQTPLLTVFFIISGTPIHLPVPVLFSLAPARFLNRAPPLG